MNGDGEPHYHRGHGHVSMAHHGGAHSSDESVGDEDMDEMSGDEDMVEEDECRSETSPVHGETKVASSSPPSESSPTVTSSEKPLALLNGNQHQKLLLKIGR